MNCANHSEVAAVAYCRTCGKALCSTCSRDVRGVIYCENCLASRLQDPVAASAMAATPALPDRAPSPGVAAALGFIPGVGAMYNGQFMKGFIHVLAFVVLIWMTDRVGFFGIMIPFLIFYMVFDAYKTAHAMELGQPLPDPFGLERLLTGTGPSTVPSAAVPPTASGANAGQGIPSEQYVAPVDTGSGPSRSTIPAGAIVLIILGSLFLLDNVGLFDFRFVHRLWPLLLIALGGWMLAKRWNRSGVN
jgi:TM2 domain-containing membrane protein YozV